MRCPAQSSAGYMHIYLEAMLTANESTHCDVNRRVAEAQHGSGKRQESFLEVAALGLESNHSPSNVVTL